MEDRIGHDRSVVQSVLEGDTEAYGELLERYQKMVASVAWRYGVPQSEIEDVVSEVFIKAYRNLHQYRPEHAFSTWLYRLAANHVVDHGRRTQKERGKTELPQQMVDPAQGPDEQALDRERARLLREALEELAPHYREVLFLVYIEGMKIDEASKTSGLPPGTIKTRLMRGREKLRRLLVRRHPQLFEAVP